MRIPSPEDLCVNVSTFWVYVELDCGETPVLREVGQHFWLRFSESAETTINRTFGAPFLMGSRPTMSPEGGTQIYGKTSVHKIWHNAVLILQTLTRYRSTRSSATTEIPVNELIYPSVLTLISYNVRNATIIPGHNVLSPAACLIQNACQTFGKETVKIRSPSQKHQPAEIMTNSMSLLVCLSKLSRTILSLAQNVHRSILEKPQRGGDQ